MTVLTANNTSEELERSGVETAVLPIGSIEQHGPHLPLGTDWMIAQEIAERVAEQLGNCYLLPTLPYSNSQEHLEFNGTVSLKPSTLAEVIRDIVLSLCLHGIKNIVIISGHGGNWILKPTIRELNLEHPDLKMVHSGPMGEKPLDIHAGDLETSCMLYLDEESVRKDRIVDSVPDLTQEYLDYVGIKAITKHGAWGQASKASKQKGEQSLKARADNIVTYVTQAFEKLSDLERKAHRRSIIPKKLER